MENNRQPIPAVEEIDEVAQGISCLWYADRQLVVYQITEISSQIVKTWADVVYQTIENWPADRPYLALHDLSRPGVSLFYASMVSFKTKNIAVLPSAQERVKAIIDAREDFRARIALNFNYTLSGKVNNLLAARQQETPTIIYKVFYNQESALHWLIEPLKANEEPSSSQVGV